MKRATFLWGLLDARDRVVLGGFLVAILASAFGVGWASAAHQARVDRVRDCAERVEQQAKKRGYQIVRLAAVLPCEAGR